MAFVQTAVSEYKSTEFYKMAVMADEYDRKRNRGIRTFTKMIYTVTGRQIPDTYSPNYKIGRAFFPFFIMQENQYLLGNGITWGDEETADKLGTKRYPIDTQVQEAGHKALSGGCSYGFWNLDHVDIFSATEFVPLFDENNGSLRSGIRYWQIDATKPFRATLYEEDGYTEYIWNKRKENGKEVEDAQILQEKKSYIQKVTGTAVDEEKIYDGENYPTFPIVPFWGNKNHQSELVGLVEQIDVYDLIKSGFCNTVEEASYVYWAIQNAPGMDEVDLARFKERISTLHISLTEDNGSTAEPKQLDAPTQSREALLERIEKDIFKDAMAFDPEQVASGAATATQIRAAYENLDLKVNDYEFCVMQFISSILELAGIDDSPTFTRSRNVNANEEIQTVMVASAALSEDYITRKILTLLGDGDLADEMIEEMSADEVTRMNEDNEEDYDEIEDEEDDIDFDIDLDEEDEDEEDEIDKELEALLKELG